MPRKRASVSSSRRSAGRQNAGTLRRLFTDTRLVAVLLLGGTALAALMGLAIWGEHGFQTMWQMQREVVELARDLETLEQENGRLRNEIHRLQHDMDYIERIAREELGLIRDDEVVIEFVTREE